MNHRNAGAVNKAYTGTLPEVCEPVKRKCIFIYPSKILLQQAVTYAYLVDAYDGVTPHDVSHTQCGE